MAYILYPFIRGLELVGTNVIIVVARISEGSNKWFHSRNSTPTILQDNTYTFKFNKVLKNISNQMYKLQTVCFQQLKSFAKLSWFDVSILL